LARAAHTGEEGLVKKVGVTGAAGFIGSHLCDRLLADGYQVVGVDDLSYGSMANLESCLQHPAFTFEQLDCTQRRPLRAAFDGCEAIMHLAAKKIPRYGGTLSTLEVNVTGVNAACSVALALDADLVVTSTSDVYGDGTPPYREDGQLVIGPPTTKRWAYAVSKMYDEHHALALADERGLKVSILRLFNCYGPRNHLTWWGGPTVTFIEALLNGEEVEIHGDGRQTRCFTYVDDTVEGFMRALETPESRGEVVNVGSEELMTITDLAAEIQQQLEIPQPLRATFVPYEALPGNYQDVRDRVPDNTKARELLGFEARIGIKEGLARTIEWHREQRLATRQQVAAGA
jgi:UDP-glucose 4-epimerase